MGPGVNYYYGVISVKVTVSGGKIVKIGIASLNDGGNPRSQYIDQQAIPILEQEVMKAQSATIQGVSGASYTTAGFNQSLQSALHLRPGSPDASCPLQHRETVMGTVVTFDVFTRPGTPDDELGDVRQQLSRAIAVMHRADEVFSTWLPDSAVSRLRRGEITVADAPAEVADVMAACATARELSDGWFDPWAMPGGFDPSGYVKGWAAQRALAELSSGCIAGALVNAAGDIASAGRMPAGDRFRIGIADPASPGRLAAVVELAGSIATSGCYLSAAATWWIRDPVSRPRGSGPPP